MFGIKSQFTEQFIGEVAQKWGMSIEFVTILLLAVLIWSAVWKLLAMWKSARKGSIPWFIIFAVTNTVGILPILYIYVFSKIDYSKLKFLKKKKSAKKSVKKKPAKRKRK